MPASAGTEMDVERSRVANGLIFPGNARPAL